MDTPVNINTKEKQKNHKNKNPAPVNHYLLLFCDILFVANSNAIAGIYKS
jgi:hypothetical protein